MMSRFDLTRFYDVIIRNSVFQLGFLTREFQIPLKQPFSKIKFQFLFKKKKKKEKYESNE